MYLWRNIMIVVGFVGLFAAASPTWGEPKPAADAKDAEAVKVKPAATPPAKADATAKDAKPAAAVELTATVESVKPEAQWRSAKDPKAKWAPLKKGQRIETLTMIRTGFGAKVTLRFHDETRVHVRSCTTMGLSHCYKANGKMSVEVGLKYGALRSNVDSTKTPTDFQVATPVATLSARGTSGWVSYSYDKGLQARSFVHIWRVMGIRGAMNLHPGYATNGKLTPQEILARRKADTEQGDPHGGQTRGEMDNLIRNGGGRGIFGFTGSGLGRHINCPGMPKSHSHDYPSRPGNDYPGNDYPTDGDYLTNRIPSQEIITPVGNRKITPAGD